MIASLLMLAAFAISMAFAVLCVLVLRFLRRREERRSPLQRKQVGHVPGQQLVDRVSDSQEEMLLPVIVMYFAVPTMLLAWALQRVPPDRIRFDDASWMYVVGAVVMFGWGLRGVLRHWRTRQNARDGLLVSKKVPGTIPRRFRRRLDWACGAGKGDRWQEIHSDPFSQPERIPEDQRNLIAQALAVRYPEVAG